jgi:DNA-directed RNA polymerase specialized sigma24 family protein
MEMTMDGTVAVLPNELALVARATAEPVAFAPINDHYFPRVYNYVRYRGGDAEMADDLTAQVFSRSHIPTQTNPHKHPKTKQSMRRLLT